MPPAHEKTDGYRVFRNEFRNHTAWSRFLSAGYQYHSIGSPAVQVHVKTADQRGRARNDRGVGARAEDAEVDAAARRQPFAFRPEAVDAGLERERPVTIAGQAEAFAGLFVQGNLTHRFGQELACLLGHTYHVASP